jgi:hypothetical protein
MREVAIRALLGPLESTDFATIVRRSFLASGPEALGSNRSVNPACGCLIARWSSRREAGCWRQSGSVTRRPSPETPYQLIAWCERFCFTELVWPVEDFFDFFLAWCDFDDFLFFVLGAVEVEVSGAIVCPPPVVAWACDWIGNVVPATKLSNANAETSAFMWGTPGSE